jgi:endonuclease III
MGFKQQGWIPYRRKAKSVEINIKDNDNQTIDFFKLYKDKTKDIKKIIRKIKEQYGFDLNPDEKDWLEKDFKW